jgi:hypothetical protein
MFTKLFAAAAVALAGITLYAGFTQQGAVVLRQENQINHWARHGTTSSGRYRGGGPGAGK